MVVMPAPLLGLAKEDLKGDYVKLGGDDLGEDNRFVSGCMSASSSELSYEGNSRCWSLWWWAKLVLVLIFVGVLAAVFLKWVGPFFMDKVCLSKIFVFSCKKISFLEMYVQLDYILYLLILLIACGKWNYFYLLVNICERALCLAVLLAL